MTSTDGLPPINGLVDVVLLDGEAYRSRVEAVANRLLTVGAPFGIGAEDVPTVGSSLELAWVIGDRRQAVDVRLRALTREQPARWELEAISQVRLQTRRNYVRGGGGEGVEIAWHGEKLLGRVVDVSEGGVRCRVPEGGFERDDRVEVRLLLDEESLMLPGAVLFVRRDPESETFDVIITYEASEAVGRAIRGYVLRREMEERRRVRESVANS